MSTDSGIPDYRDAQGEWKRPPPVTYQAFMGDAGVRQRYWARSLVGWRVMAQAQPGLAHRALAKMAHAGRVSFLLTQNVDGLHEAAGSPHFMDLHGRIDTVRCMACEVRWPRAALQPEMEALNPAWTTLAASPAPDGDADVEAQDFRQFQVPTCPQCGGLLKPDVVFFGESVPRERVHSAMAALTQSDAVLVVGSSLMVYSGYRFVQAAAQAGQAVAALNLGRTRADELLQMKVTAPCGEALQAVVHALGL